MELPLAKKQIYRGITITLTEQILALLMELRIMEIQEVIIFILDYPLVILIHIIIILVILYQILFI